MTVDELVEAVNSFPDAREVTMGESTYEKIKASDRYDSAIGTFCGLIIRIIPGMEEDKIFLR